MSVWLREAGIDAIHTLDLVEGNRTTDAHIVDLAVREHRIVVTKDADFVDSHSLQGRPDKLLLISTGNLTNTQLEALLRPLIPMIVLEFQTNSFLKLGSSGLVVRG
ncbi:MAG TPA: DUF5615 family PIN-like protein [Tepidisphaeraceae bacterium]